jgi:serine/threonine-protein kinase
MRPDIAPARPVEEVEESREPQPRRRSVLRDVLLVMLVAVVGFLVAALWLSPVSLFAHDDVIPLLVGSSLSDAESQLSGLGYRVRVAPAVESPEIERGKIMRQDPPAGTIAPRSTVVIVTPSAGQMPVAVPDLVGLEMSQAIKVLGAAGLKPGAIDSVIDRQEDGGVVLGTRPSAGAGRMPGSTVDLIVNGANQ